MALPGEGEVRAFGRNAEPVSNKNFEPFGAVTIAPSRADKFREFARRTTNCRVISRPRADARGLFSDLYRSQSFREQARARALERKSEREMNGESEFRVEAYRWSIT